MAKVVIGVARKTKLRNPPCLFEAGKGKSAVVYVKLT